MKIREVMKRFPATVHADDDLALARDYMVWMGIRHLPVVDDGKLVGLLTELDIATYQAQLGQGPRGGYDHPVERAMQSQAQTATPDDSVTEAMARMAQYKIDCLPITELGKLVGIVTVTDILAAQVQEAMAPTPSAGPTVAEAMTRDPQVVHPDDHITDAAARMQTHGIRHLPVIDGDGTIIGMLSDRDVRTAVGDPRRMLEEPPPVRIAELRVRDAMSAPVITARPDELCTDVARYFTDLAASAVPVVDDDEKLVGIVSYIDILRVLAQEASLRPKP